MKLTAPVYVLKRQAKELKRTESITMVEALNRVAQREGFASWSLLQSRTKTLVPKVREDVLDYLNPGDLVLIGARPGLGKTMLTIQLLLQAIEDGRRCFFFSLEYTDRDFIAKVTSLDKGFDPDISLLRVDCSDAISADYIIGETSETVEEGSLIAVDCLQLLDQQRHKPPVQQQIEALKSYAREKRCILIFISQIDRIFDLKEGTRPNLDDVRLPNPLDLGMFNKSIFVQHDQIFI